MSTDSAVSSVMKRTAVSVTPSTTLRDVAEILVREDIGAVVVRGTEGPAGIVTERDLVRAIDDDADFEEQRAADAMTYDVVWLSPDDDVATAARTMVDGGIRHLPVLSDGDVVGIISIRDVLASLLD